MTTYLRPGVFVEEVDSGSRPIEGVGTAVAAFVGLARKGPTHEPTLVSNWTQYVTNFGGPLPGAFLGQSVFAYFQNGGGNCYVVRVNEGEDPDEPVGGNGRSVALPPPPEAVLPGLKVIALDPAPPGEIVLEVAEAGGESPTDDMFKLVVRLGGEVREEFDRVTVGRGRSNVVTTVNQQSKTVKLQVAGEADRPAPGTVAVLAPPPPAPVPVQRLSSDDYVGDVAERTGLSGLEAVDEVTMVCAPDLMAAYEQGAIDHDGVLAVQGAMIDHCRNMGDRMAILDTPLGLNAQGVLDWRRDKAGYDSPYAALYWPWVRALDPTTGQATFLPPSGHIAGVWGRNDDSRGVHKAPANEVVSGALGLELQITNKEQELLNPVGINCLRAFPGRGIRVWGARTLSTSDPAWRYVNVRRLFNYLEESILNGTNWAVFEPNDAALWAKIRRTISAFLVNEWRKGALFGQTPDEAFYVKCDSETNPAEGIDAGQVVCEIGVAPVKPAEFVIFRLAQFSGGTSLVSE